MNRAKRLKVVNILLFVFLVYQLVTGVLFWLTDSETLEALHPVGGLILVVLACIHIALNWGWVRSAFPPSG